MTWLTWRQFRPQAIGAAAVVAVLAGLFLMTGPHLAHLYAASGLAACHSPGGCPQLASQFLAEAKADSAVPILFFTGFGILIALPAIIGAFWGAPMITRELESGTYKLAWNQGVSRARWMAVKIGILGLATMATAGLLSLAFTWWVSPVDKAGGFPATMTQLSRLSPEMFADRGIVPAGWAVFAFVLGVAAGLTIRRTVPAMAVTLAVAAALAILWPGLVRSHLMTPRSTTAPVTATALSDAIMTHAGEMIFPVSRPGSPVSLPGAWIVTNRTVTPAGRVFVLPVVAACQTSSLGSPGCDHWVLSQHLRQTVSYLPASDFWPLQGLETAILLAAAAGLGAACTWRVRHVLT
jgi:hypothetical protein